MENDSTCLDWRSKLRRLFHWGPLIVFPIIFFISSTTIIWSVRTSPPSTSLLGSFQLFFLSTMLYLILRSYFSSIFVGPGFVPLGWMPSDRTAVNKLQYCRKCRGYKPPRSHHCRSCQRCVMKMDHHCPWINTCCGHLNHRHFVIFVFSASTGCLGCVLILTPIAFGILTSLPEVFYESPAAMVDSVFVLLKLMFALGLAIGVFLSVGFLGVYQLLSLCKNETFIESWILKKAKNRRIDSTLEPFVYPYDLGVWNNIRQVLTWSDGAIGDGIHWPIRPGCNEYDLTAEQIRQKKIKLLLRREFQVIADYDGRCCSGWRFGCCTGCRSPFPNEPCLPVKPGDSVLVTSWSKYWLYGELKTIPTTLKNGCATTAITEPQRGWVPSLCLVQRNRNGKFPKDECKQD